MKNYYACMLIIHLKVDAVSNTMFPWRQMPEYVFCIVDAHPLPPDPVNTSDIVILHQDFNHKFLFLNMSWSFPNALNGMATNFEVRIAREYLEPTEMDDPTDYPLRQHTVVGIVMHDHHVKIILHLPGKSNIYNTHLSIGETPLSICPGKSYIEHNNLNFKLHNMLDSL